MKHNDAVTRLVEHGIKPSVQRIQIMHYLMTHFTHPTVEEVHKALLPKVPTLSRTTVYNTLRMFSEHNAAQMITINEHRVCYDGDVAFMHISSVSAAERCTTFSTKCRML